MVRMMMWDYGKNLTIRYMSCKQPGVVYGHRHAGATFARDGIEPYFETYPLLYEIAELGVGLERAEKEGSYRY